MQSFAVETRADENTLTDREVFFCLQQAVSSVQSEINIATKQLQEWEKSPGYFSILQVGKLHPVSRSRLSRIVQQSIYLDQSLPFETRSLAIIQLKNGIDRYWRRGATNAIAKDEKTLIRDRSLGSCLSEPLAGLAVHVAVVNAKIVRYDFPNVW